VTDSRFKECDSCGWPMDELVDGMCDTCRSTLGGNALLYPTQYSGSTRLSMKAQDPAA
jgi:hypothetical protein